MNKKTLIIASIVMVFIMACGGGDDNSSSTGGKLNTFLGGTSGLSVEFVENSPPSEVFDGGSDPFDIELVLKNQGETTIDGKTVKITLGGISPAAFGKSEKEFIVEGLNFDIEATYKDYQGNTYQGVEEYYLFPNLRYTGTLLGNQEFPIWLEVCYNYETRGKALGCILPNPRSTDPGPCVVDEEKPVESSGSPVQVTKFIEQPAGSDTVKYLFTIEHKGTGTIYAPYSRCPKDNDEQKYVIRYEVKSQNSDLSCSGSSGANGKAGEFKLRPGQEYVLRCTQVKKSDIPQTDEIELYFDYDYKQTISESILVKKNI